MKSYIKLITQKFKTMRVFGEHKILYTHTKNKPKIGTTKQKINKNKKTGCKQFNQSAIDK